MRQNLDKQLRFFRSLCVAGTILAANAAGQVSNFDGKTVLRVAYAPVRQPLASEDLRRLQQLTEGSPYSAKDVAQTIDRLFASGAYADIQVDVEQEPAGVVVTYRTKSAQFTGHVRVTGKISSPPNRSTLTSTAGLRVGTPFDDASLATAEKSIRQLFTSNGLYGARVAVERDVDAGDDLVGVTIRVEAGKRARYDVPTLLGQKTLADSTIVRATGWRVILIHRWRNVSQSLTQKGLARIRSKYKGKDLLTASVELVGMDFDPERERVTPQVQIEAGPKIEVKAVNAKVSKGRVRRLVPIYEEGTVDTDLMFEGARNLRDYFQSSGYPDAEVDFRTTPVANDRQTIEFIVTKGARKKLARVDIQGSKYFTSDAIRERMFLVPNSFRFRHGRYSEAFRKRDEETIADLYRANGFRDVMVTSAITNDYKGKPDQVAVTYKIEEGDQWRVAKLDTEGIDEKDALALRGQLSEIEGEPYSDVGMQSDRSLILQHYYRQGFPKAEFEWTAIPAGEPHRVEIRYKVTLGPQEFVRDVKVLGLTRTRPSLVDKHLHVHPGDPLSLVDLDASQRELDNLGVFARVEAAVQNPDGEASRKYVLYDIDEAARYNVRIGVGAEIAQLGATTTNLNAPVGGTGFSPRFLLNLNRIDFLGLGHTITFDGRYSNLEQRAAVSYLVRDFLNSDRRTLTFSTLYDVATNVRTFSARREEASAQVSQKLSKPTTVLFRYAYRRVATSNIVIPDLLVPQLSQPVRIGIISANLVQDRRDNPANAHSGLYNTIDVGIASQFLGSQRNFVRVLGRNATYSRLPRKMVLARQTTFGVIKPFNLAGGIASTDAVPLPERFFGGGNLTDRGFGENQAGPRDIGMAAGPSGISTQPTGFPLGGNALFFNNTELRFPLLGDNIDGVFFHDVGNIYSTFSSISFRVKQKNDQDFNYMVHAVGFGIRYRTPVGPVRADFAYSINPPAFVGFNGTIDQLLNCNPSLPLGQLPGYCMGVPQHLSHFQFFFSIGQTF